MLLFALLILSLSGMAATTNPGVKARITQKGFTYASTVAQAAIAKELQTLHIDDQSGHDGHISWEFKHINNRGVTPPTSHISVDPTHHGIAWTLSNLGIKLKADWRIKYKKGWVKASTSGSVDVKIQRVSATVAVSLGVGAGGRPSMQTAACQANIGDVDLDFHGGTGWLINLFKHPLEKKVRDILQGQICKVVTKEINEDGNKALAKLKVTVKVLRKFLLDYSLTSAPVATGTYLEVFDKGEVFWEGDRAEAPFTPTPIPALSEDTCMFYMWLTQYTAQTFLYAGHTHGYLKHNVTKDNLPEGSSSYLNTTCKTGMCIGTLIEQIGQKFPNRQVRMALKSTSVPDLHIDPKGVTLEIKADIDMYAEAPGTETAYLLTLNMTLSLSLDGAIEKEKLVGKITSHSFNLGVEKSAVGELNVAKLNIVLGGILTLVVIPELNKQAAAGVDLPVTGNVKFSNTSLRLLQGSILVATDLTYTPSASWDDRETQLKTLGDQPTFKVVNSQI